MLWILHLGYAWVPAGLFILAVQLSGAFYPWSAGIHALMAGAMSTLILGMIARVALGHSGPPITASRLTVIGFVLITAAAIIRVTAAVLVAPAWLSAVAGLLWSLAFLLYLVVYTPVLLRNRTAPE